MKKILFAALLATLSLGAEATNYFGIADQPPSVAVGATLDSAVAKGTWTTSGTWTLPAMTLGGTVSGGGQQLNNIIIGTTTPLAGAFTTVTGTSWNGNTWATGTGTLSIGAGKTFTASNTLTFTGTDSSSVAFGAGGTVAYQGGALGAATATSVLASGIIDGTVPIDITTGTSASLGGTYKTGYTFNNQGSAVTYTLPTAAAGLQFCVKNYTGRSNTVRVNTSAAGQYIDYVGANTASGGYVISAGALGDGACFVGADATHWVMYNSLGTWTVN